MASGNDPAGHSATRAVPPCFAAGPELVGVEAVLLLVMLFCFGPLLDLELPQAAAAVTVARTPTIATNLRVLLTAIKPSPSTDPARCVDPGRSRL
ncbi:hypothetical protein GCM10009838_77360 [Catenulispora subtropica]|uniref:Uncharacterized protein n=1 Tax=Catenulispora subtropica TaxID=450798 RepID=A0ABN2T6Y7_9ACTN